MLLATVSYMTGNEFGYGCRYDSVEMKKKYAQSSLSYNKRNEKFMSLFGKDL
jgi:hypothetical protein